LKIDNTNAKDLELYAVMGEQHNASIPLAHLLLSNATLIEPGRWKIALISFFTTLRAKYAVEPRFIHIDKDIAEIKAAQTV
jgi:hypothetical protein